MSTRNMEKGTNKFAPTYLFRSTFAESVLFEPEQTYIWIKNCKPMKIIVNIFNIFFQIRYFDIDYKL